MITSIYRGIAGSPINSVN